MSNKQEVLKLLLTDLDSKTLRCKREYGETLIETAAKVINRKARDIVQSGKKFFKRSDIFAARTEIFLTLLKYTKRKTYTGDLNSNYLQLQIMESYEDTICNA